MGDIVLRSSNWIARLNADWESPRSSAANRRSARSRGTGLAWGRPDEQDALGDSSIAPGATMDPGDSQRFEWT